MLPASPADNDGFSSPLGAEDQRRLLAAIGFVELAMGEEADRELDGIAPERRVCPDVLAVRASAFLLLERWELAAEVARHLTRVVPERPEPWISLAYATCHLQSMEAALGVLQRAERLHHANEPSIHFNLARYLVQLGQEKRAKQHLERAVGLDAGFCRLAREEPELAPLWASS